MIPPGLEASIALLRHGESVFITEGRYQGQADNPLSPLGERQAQLAAARLAAPHRSPALPLPRRAPLEIAHSPLGRTTRTASFVAAAMAEATGAPPPRLRADPGVAEIAQGEWEGLAREEVEAGWPDVVAAWRQTPVQAQAPGGERLVEVQLRVRGVIERLLAGLATGGSAPDPADGAQRTSFSAAGYPAALAPDTPWSVLVGHDGVFKVLLLTLFELPLERFWSFPFALCGISVIEIRSGRAVLRAHNVTEHLAPLLDERAQAITEARQRTGQL